MTQSWNDSHWQALRRDAETALSVLERYVKNCCPGEHKVVQHRDGKPPWCPDCGRDRLGHLRQSHE